MNGPLKKAMRAALLVSKARFNRDVKMHQRIFLCLILKHAKEQLGVPNQCPWSPFGHEDQTLTYLVMVWDFGH